MAVFKASSYKQVLRWGVVKPKTFSAMAEHCRVQKTYLSKVLNQEAHLSEDQIFLALQYLELSEDEKRFALLLHSWERAQVVERRTTLERQIEALRTEKLKTEANIRVKAEPGADLTEYYLDPFFQIIHMMLTLKRFQQNALGAGEPLGLSRKKVLYYLDGLSRMKLVRVFESKGVLKAQVLRDGLHLSDRSPLHTAYSARMRLKAIERMDQIEKSDAYSFSAVFSTTPLVRRKIHESFVEWLKGIQAEVQGGAEEEVYQMGFDLFKWS